MMVGEIYLPDEERAKYYGARRDDNSFDECHLPFNFQLVELPWKAETIKYAVEAYYASIPMGGWPNWVLGNHDKHRIATRIGLAQARVANMLLLTLWGTPTTYYGEEIGMENVDIPLEFLQDPRAVNQPEIAHVVGRDPERTPMQWDASPNAGFTREGAIPWLPIAEDHGARNVAVQGSEPASMLSFYRALTALRRSEPALRIGDFTVVDVNEEDIFAYRRFFKGSDDFLVVLNFEDGTHALDLSGVADIGVIEVSTGMSRSGAVDLGSLQLAGNEGLVIRLG
jgi:alpha-glucosidase